MRNQAGLSLIEILIGMGVLSAMILGFVSTIELSQKGNLNSEQKQSSLQFHNELYALLENQAICSMNFGSTAVAPAAQKNIKNFPEIFTKIVAPPGPGVKYESNKVYMGNLLKLKNLTLKDFQPQSGVWGLATLSYELEKSQKSIGISTFKEKQIQLKIELTAPYDSTAGADNLVKNCLAVGGMGESIWVKKPNNDIYYEGGNVGIGTASPNSALNVNGVMSTTWGTAFNSDFIGGVWKQTSAGYAGLLQFDSTLGKFYVWNSAASAAAGAANPIAVQSLAIDSAGNIGIRTSNPQDELHIREAIGSTDAELRLEYAGSGGGTSRQYSLSASSDGGFHILDKDLNVQRVSVRSNGNVGIGTTSPTYLLSLNGGVVEGDSFAVSSSGDIIASGGSDRRWAIYNSALNPILTWDDNTGHMGVAGNAVGGVTLKVHGSIEYSGGGNISDIRYKKNIKPIQGAIEKILKLTGVTFDWNREKFPKEQFKTGTAMGLIAQEVEKVVPEVVNTDSNGYKSLEYANLVALLAEGIKQQQKLIEEKDQEIQTLKSQVTRIVDAQAQKDHQLNELHVVICEANPKAKLCR